ncbi:MAG TPA: hypothetical protein P5534_23155, partial [Candidatus Paceibacterota bacterium]|nr:hypothetical protein [Candidatus Paceibacterota bacterium]
NVIKVIWGDDWDPLLTRDANGTDTATSGLWERGNPQGTDSSGPKQLNATVSGVNDLVTGALAGSNAGSYDVDGGVTSIRSPAVTLPRSGDITLSFSYYFAHGNNSSTADYLRCWVVGATALTVFEELGAAEDDDAAWAIKNVDISAFAGQTVHLLFEAADSPGASLVEAAIDDVLVVVKSVPPGTFYVTRAADGGEGSLREAILDANAYGNGARIEFIEGLGNFAPASAWPDIMVAVVMDIGSGNALTRGLTVSGGGALETRGARGSVLGTLAVSNGSLTVTDQALADCAVWVGSNGSLQGEGAVGELTIGSGGILTPGASPGTLTAGSTTWNGGGLYRCEINDATGAAGDDPGWDVLDVSGTLTIDAESGDRFVINLATLELDNTAGEMVHFDAAQDFSWTLVRTTEGVLGFAADKFTLDASGVVNPLSGGRFELSVVGADLVLSFVKAAPTAASLAWFRSTLLGSGQIAIEWQTLVEVQVIGFYLERSADEGAWQRVTHALVPAAAQDVQPQVYRVMDIVKPAADLRYRLVEVDLRGQDRIVAESALMWPVELRISRSDGGLVLHLASPSSGTAVIEVAENPVAGPWTQFWKVALSDARPASVRLESPPGSSTRFYRARLESPGMGR